MQEDYVMDKTIHQKAHLIFFNYSNSQQTFVQTYISPSRSTHVVLLQPGALITTKRCLISKHMGKILTLHFLPLLRHQILVILTLGEVEACVLPLVLSVSQSETSKECGKRLHHIFYQEKAVYLSSHTIHPPTPSPTHRSIYPYDLLAHQIMGLFSLQQPITLWSLSGNCLVLLQ